MRVTFYLIKSTIVGALGGLLFGFDTAVIAGTTHQLTDIYKLTPTTLGLTVSIALWGTVFGSLLSGALGQRIGGREALRFMAGLYIVSAIGCALAWNWPALICFRFIGGLGIGGSSVLGPVYIAELRRQNSGSHQAWYSWIQVRPFVNGRVSNAIGSSISSPIYS